MEKSDCVCGKKFTEANPPIICKSSFCPDARYQGSCENRCKQCFLFNSHSFVCPTCYTSTCTSDKLVIDYHKLNGTEDCPICYEDIKGRKILNCGHSVCYNCAFGIVKSKRVMCPMCRNKITTSANPPTRNDFAYLKIWSWDLRFLYFHIKKNQILPDDLLKSAIKEYRKFMALKMVERDWNAQTLSPPPILDVIWHAHILFTEDYLNFCNVAIGRMVHHNPNGTFEKDEKISRQKTTLQFLFSIFGELCPHDKSFLVWFPEDTLEAFRRQDIFSSKDYFSSKDSYDIFVKSGKTMQISVRPETFVWELKLHITAKKGIPMSQQRLVFAGKNLNINKTMAECGIQKYSHLHLVLRIAGC